jgi:hypothetical protein
VPGGCASRHILRTCVISSGISLGKLDRYRLGMISNFVYLVILELLDMVSCEFLIGGVVDVILIPAFYVVKLVCMRVRVLPVL